jgi:ribonuclease HI
MNDRAPQYVVVLETGKTLGQWRFVLRPHDGSPPIEAGDIEPNAWGERLDLLTAVRALESLDQPSRVTFVGCTRYVEQGILYGVSEWKQNDWRWECFGQMVPVRDSDLWQRMDRALQFHRVDCRRRRRFDSGHSLPDGPHWKRAGVSEDLRNSVARIVRKTWDASQVPAGLALLASGIRDWGLLMFAWIMNRQVSPLGPFSGVPLVGLGSFAVKTSKGIRWALRRLIPNP